MGSGVSWEHCTGSVHSRLVVVRRAHLCLGCEPPLAGTLHDLRDLEHAIFVGEVVSVRIRFSELLWGIEPEQFRAPLLAALNNL